MTDTAATLLDPYALDLDGTLLIEASAGTGKTYTITTLVARLVAEGYPIDSILVVTFTEAAAAELKLRIRDRLVQCLEGDADDDLRTYFAGQEDFERITKRLRLAVTCFDQAAVMTIHSFCFSVLRENAFESGTYFDMELLADSQGFLRQTVMDFFGSRINDLDPLLLAWFQQAGVSPKAFERDFSRVVSRPGIRTLPGEAGFRDIGDAYRELVWKMANTLALRQEEIAALILDHSGVDKRSYSKRNVPAWLEKCREALEDAGETRVFTMTEKGDPLYKFTRTRLADKTKGGAPPDHEFFDQCQELLELTSVLGENLVRIRLDFLSFFHEALAAMKQAQGACFFDDLINDLWAALAQDRGPTLKAAVLARYRACLIDEFQDTDPAQYRIFSRLFSREGTPFFMIGDPKQAIYAFRGGDIFAYLSARQQASGRFTLGVNYRSAPGLVRAVNHLFSLCPDPFGFKEIPFFPVGVPAGAADRLVRDGTPVPPLQIAFSDREGTDLDRGGRMTKAGALEQIPGILARDMLSLLKDPGLALAGTHDRAEALSPGDMAVLVRTNAQAEAVRKALAARGIPSYLSKTGSVFDSPQALELFDLLSAVNSPDSPGLMKAALTGSLFGCEAETLALMDRDQALMDLWQDRFALFSQLWKTRGFTAMINQVFHGRDIVPSPGTGCSERALTNFYHLAELVAQAAQKKSLSGPYLLNWYEQQLVPETREESSDELRLESDGRAVAIVTIHKSKGLEYPIVFLPFLWDRKTAPGKAATALFHDPEAGFALTLDLGSQAFERAVQQAAQEQEAEEMRLLYVALTRASAMCRIYWAGVSGCDRTALGTLVHPKGAGDDPAMKGQVKTLADGSGRSIALVVPEPCDPSDVYREERPKNRTLEARRFDRQVQPSWRITSYSGLVSARGRADAPVETGSQDSGPGPAGTDGPGTDDERYSWEEVQAHLGPPPEDGTGGHTAKILLENFPKGATAGDFFHNVLELIDFTDPEGIDPAVTACLDRYGFSRDRYQDMASESVRHILAAELKARKGDRFTLGQVPESRRFTELEFCFDLKQWDLGQLADLFETESVVKPYAERLRQMSTPDFKGFLKGFIDLVVCQGGRWYILDYKSNFLGAHYGDYSPEAMGRAMVSHDYLLQFHLYLIALDRYLSLRLKGYDYDTHFGGGFYLFIRGMKPGRDTGIYFHSPSSRFMARLRDLV